MSHPSGDQPIDLVHERRGKPPRLPGVTVFRHDSDTLIDALLADLYIHAGNCVRAFGDFHLALSPEPLLEPAIRRLMFDLGYREFPWQRTRLWLTEEVDVPAEDERRLGAGLRGLLADPAGIPPEQVHVIQQVSAHGAEAYERSLQEHLGWREKGQDRIDFVMLGLGPHGEIAGHRQLTAGSEDEALVCYDAASARGAAGVRVSMRLMNAARVVAVVASGEAARVPLASLTAPGSHSPARGLRPVGGELRWYVDSPACTEVVSG